MKNNMRQLKFSNLDCEINYWYRKGSENNWVIFLHGAGVDHEMFENQFNIFDETYNLIAWDARGHGESNLEQGKRFRFKDMISDLKKIYEIYNIDKAIIIGQSMGGNLAQEIAYYHPQMTDKIVLIDCSKNTGKLTTSERYALKCSKFIFNCYPEKFLVKQCANACGNKEEVREYAKNCFSKVGKSRFIDIMMELTEVLHEDEEFRFKQKVLLICGRDDKLGNIKKIICKWAESDSNCRLFMIDDAGHNSNQDKPEVVNEFIYNFINNY